MSRKRLIAARIHDNTNSNGAGNISDLQRNTMMTTPPAPLGVVLSQVYGAMGMGVDVIEQRAPDSAWMCDYWDQTDAIVEGIKALRDAGDKYLPKFDDEELTAYQARLKLTKLTNVYRDIVESLAAKPFEQEVKILDDVQEDADPTAKQTLPPEIESFVENVDGAGNNLTMFAASVFFNGINSAIDWIFVDAPKADPSIRTQADAVKAGVQPFWSHVLGRNVLEATTQMIGGKETLSYIRILEPGTPKHVRIFERQPTGEILWQLWVKTTTYNESLKTFYALEDDGSIDVSVIPLVPFITGRRDGRTFKIFPAMRDAADLQIELYQQESGLKFIKTLAGYPMLAANGIRPEMMADGKTPKKLAVRPMAILYSKPDGQGNAGSWAFIEPAATSMKFLGEDVKETIQQLRELGRQPLTAQSGNLTVITTAVAAGKAKSAVKAWALALKDTLENAMKITCMFMNSAYEPEVEVFTDFDDVTDQGKDLLTLNAMRAARDLSQPTYWRELERRNVLSPEFDPDVERALLLKEAPADVTDPNVDGGDPSKPANNNPPGEPGAEPGDVIPPAPGKFSTRGM